MLHVSRTRRRDLGPTWARGLQGCLSLGTLGASATTPALDPQPVCEEETGELRGPRHGQKKAPTWDSIRKSEIGMLAIVSGESGPMFQAELNSDSSRQVHAANFTVGDRT